MYHILILALTLGLSLGIAEAYEDKEIMDKEIMITQEESVPAYLYKLVTVEQWQRSQGQPWVELSSADKGFVHLSKEEQVDHIAKKYFAGKDYILLKLDAYKLEGRLVYETNPNGSTKYYHLYEGGIPLEAVFEAHTICALIN